LTVLSAAWLSACGGGGGGAVSEAPPALNAAAGTVGTSAVPVAAAAPLAAPAPTPVPVPAPDASPSAAASCDIPDFQNQLLQRVNALRASGATCSGRPAPAVAVLQWDNALFSAAQVHSQDMVSNSFMGHTGSDGKNVGQRVTDQGYPWTFVGENIAAGQTTTQSVLDDWMSSTSGHCENIMSANARNLGAACLVKPNDAQNYGTYWTLVLAKR